MRGNWEVNIVIGRRLRGMPTCILWVYWLQGLHAGHPWLGWRGEKRRQREGSGLHCVDLSYGRRILLRFGGLWATASAQGCCVQSCRLRTRFLAEPMDQYSSLGLSRKWVRPIHLRQFKTWWAARTIQIAPLLRGSTGRGWLNWIENIVNIQGGTRFCCRPHVHSAWGLEGRHAEKWENLKRRSFLGF